jgi:hypothetical protein
MKQPTATGKFFLSLWRSGTFNPRDQRSMP